MEPILYSDDNIVVTGDNSEEAKEKVFQAVMAYFIKHKSFWGESIAQSDNTIIDAPDVMCDIADNIIKFKVREA